MKCLRPVRAVRTLVSAALLAGPALVDAQQPVVMQHGFLSDRATWEDAADRLEHDFVVKSYRYTTGSTNTFAAQAGIFMAQRAADALPGNTIGVAHSNGSRVLRLSAQDGSQFSGIITVGGTHGGVPLTASAGSGLLVTMAWYLGGRISAPFDYYLSYALPTWLYYLMVASEDYASVVFWMVAGLDVATGVSPAFGFPVLAEMPYALPSTASEVTNAPTRVGIVSNIAHGLTGLTAHGVYPNQWEFIRNSQFTAIGFGLGMYEYFTFYLDETQPNYWPLYVGRYLWVDMAVAVYDVDWFWCDAIGALDYQGCRANDGILPATVQEYPNSTTDPIDIFGPSHQEETRSDQFYGRLSEQLDAMQVARRVP